MLVPAVAAEAADCCALLPADVVFNSLLSASANGYGLKDVGAMFLAVQQAAGVLPPGKHLENMASDT